MSRTPADVLREIEAKQKADRAKIDETFAQFGKCLTTWANIEYALLFVFQEALGRPNLKLTSATFYSIENFRSKVGVVDSVVSIILEGDGLLEQWSGKGGLLSRLQSKGKIRNSMAHCGASYEYTNRVREVNISSPIYNPRRPTNRYTVKSLDIIKNEFQNLLNDLSAFAMLLDKPAKRWLESAPPMPHLLRIRNQYGRRHTKPKAPPEP